ncbi:DUF3025 domain-containing protein, partial [Aquabacterium sp. A08]|nr:DUF3025 domain-containing protein [Aquabacterium sp. A08]
MAPGGLSAVPAPLPVEAPGGGPHCTGAVDWVQPWFAPWRGVGAPLAAAAQRTGHWPDSLNAAGLAPVRFVPQTELPEGVAYESHIHATGAVPTRENLHDFFNALCWMRFPQT